MDLSKIMEGTIGAGIFGGTVGACKSIYGFLVADGIIDLSTEAIPTGDQVVHTIILSSFGAVAAIIAKIIFRKFFPKPKDKRHGKSE